ncbi:ABC transporter permease [Candidatus Marinamargulisbacteria bacterium SCGC AG-414-C22]|nr:ABC transporter permease [Candidatus Marinamargulisbacteria bacterium SCGC AG-414-C22]
MMSRKILIRPFEHIGELFFLVIAIFKSLFTTNKLFNKTIEQCYILGFKSFFSIFITAVFIGMVFTLQIISEFDKFGANYLIGGIVGLAIWRELGPLISAVVASGRIGSAISSEIATMKVSEQIEALEALSCDPIKILVTPRVIATTFMLPLLVCVADLAGFFSGLGIAYYIGNINMFAYFNSAQSMLNYYDIVGGLIKAGIFGFVLSLISCYQGLLSKPGAKGVGNATTKAVVISLVSIFILNYFLTVILF